MSCAGGTPRSAVWIAADLDRRLQACRQPATNLQQLGEALWRETEARGVPAVEAALDGLQDACGELSLATASPTSHWSAWLLLEPPAPRHTSGLALLQSSCTQLEEQLDAFLLRHDGIRIADRDAAVEFGFEADRLRKQVDKACGELQLLYEDLQQKYAHATATPALEALDRLRAHAGALSQTLHAMDAVCTLAAVVQAALARITRARVRVLETLQGRLPLACERLRQQLESLEARLAPGGGRVRAAEEARADLLAQLDAARDAISGLHAGRQALGAALRALHQHLHTAAAASDAPLSHRPGAGVRAAGAAATSW